jgi:hypothetical protein
LLAEYDNPVVYVLGLMSAVLRVITNLFKLLKFIGGNVMYRINNISNTIVKKLTNVVETLLVVGNLGVIMSYYPLLAMKDWVDFPRPEQYIHAK